MIPAEILKKVARIEIQTRGLVNDVLSGEYHSVFKGRGMEFAEVREYQYGDDIRTIDWNVSARMGHPFVKVFEEERELTVMLLMDVSSSGDFGTHERMKGDIAVEICALLAFSAIKNQDKVGLILFSDRIEKFIPPKKGKQHVLRVLRELLYFRPDHSRTAIGVALQYLNRVVNKRSVVFLVSDFLSSGYEAPLRIANRRHDVVAISVTDPRERALPDAGFVELEDAETGEMFTLDTGDLRVRDLFGAQTSGERMAREKLFRSINVDFIDIATDASYVEPLIRFFKMREKRFQ